MYLSKLILNPSPACRAARRDLASPYEMHRTILRAFPDRADGGPGRVLFRVEPVADGSPPVVLVQSDKPPDWSLLGDADGYLAATPACKPVTLSLRPGQRLRFRLRANPTARRKVQDRSLRVGLPREEDQLAWLTRKGQAGGFKPLAVTTLRSRKVISRRQDRPQTHLSVDFEGILEVTDPDLLTRTIAQGVGSAKGYGFGLLSVAPG